MSEIEMLEQRLRDVAVGRDDADWADVVGRVGGARPPRRRAVVALAACAAIGVPAAVFASLHAGASNRPTRTSPGSWGVVPNTLLVDYDGSGEAVSSLTVTASPVTADASAAIEVIGGPLGGAPDTVVYQKEIALSSPTGASPDQRPTWTGTLSPSDWSGGCRVGWGYSVLLVAVGRGTSLADVLAKTPAEQERAAESAEAHLGRFACGANPG